MILAKFEPNRTSGSKVMTKKFIFGPKKGIFRNRVPASNYPVPGYPEFCHYPVLVTRFLTSLIRSKYRTWKKLILHASPWSVDPCSSGLALQTLHKFLDLESQGGPHWFYFFTVVPPLINQQKKSCRVWESRPLEHGSALNGEAWRINFFHVIYFDLIKYPKKRVVCPVTFNGRSQVF